MPRLAKEGKKGDNMLEGETHAYMRVFKIFNAIKQMQTMVVLCLTETLSRSTNLEIKFSKMKSVVAPCRIHVVKEGEGKIKHDVNEY